MPKPARNGQNSAEIGQRKSPLCANKRREKSVHKETPVVCHGAEVTNIAEKRNEREEDFVEPGSRPDGESPSQKNPEGRVFWEGRITFLQESRNRCIAMQGGLLTRGATKQGGGD